MSAFMRSVDTKLLGRKTYEMSLRLGAKFDSKSRTIVFSRHAPPADAPSGVEFVSGAIGPFVRRLREQPGKDIWLMGGGGLIASFLIAGLTRVSDSLGLLRLTRAWPTSSDDTFH
jgi:dihydrofolate reductase